jgi:[CysO sulfur-carrier protein]-S-L-cysteine hydrolase
MRGSRPCLTFLQQTFDQMLQFAWSVYPAEAVGLVGGSRGVVTGVYELENIAPFRTFFADPYSQFCAMKTMKAAGERLMATFHSHPEGAAKMSKADRKYVFEVSPIAIVIALCKVGHTSHVAAFLRSNGRIKEIELCFTSASK